MPTTPQARYKPLPASIHTFVESTPNAILLETSRFDAANHHSYLFLNPVRILTAASPDEIPSLFAQIEAALTEGLHIAGYFSYECNAHFEPTLRVPHPYAHLRTAGNDTARQSRQLLPSAQDPHSYAASSRTGGEADSPDPTARVPHSYAASSRTGGEAESSDPTARVPHSYAASSRTGGEAESSDPTARVPHSYAASSRTGGEAESPDPTARVPHSYAASSRTGGEADSPDPTARVPHSYAASSRTGGEAESSALPLAHLAAYPPPIVFDHATGLFLDPPSRVPQVSLLRPGIPQTFAPTSQPDDLPPSAQDLRIPDTDYLAAIEKIKAYIAAGDTYQVNFTDAVEFPTTLSPATLFTTLSQNQSVAYAAYLNLGTQSILSFSPELFFQISGHKITTRPMKGTMPRGLDTTEDAAAARALQHDEKNRAEHVMIVDLLRNDLGRISTPGSVHVDDLFRIESYQTLHQMTSTISATLRPHTTFYDIFAAMFPCGSVTGTPKIRTMQIIRELEAHPRGVYTGAIGHIAPDRSATFNVAIRTLVLHNGHAHMGVGGGIVADSIPADEHREALLKASFLTRTHQPFELIETLLFDQHYARLPLHLDRLESSAQYFDFVCDRTAVEAQLRAFAHFLDPREPHRVRLLLAPDGTASITAHPLKEDPRVPHPYASLRTGGNDESSQPPPSAQDPTAITAHPLKEDPRVPHPYAPLRTGGNDESSQPPPSAQDPTAITVTLSPHRTNSADPYLRHKTTHRNLYNDELTRARAEGFEEILFLNERNELTEGAISNLFVEQPTTSTGAGKFLTPPLTSGVLPGVMRRHLLETLPNAEERILTLADLDPPNTLWLCNSLRGLRRAILRLEP